MNSDRVEIVNSGQPKGVFATDNNENEKETVPLNRSVTALYSYQAQSEAELSFQEGDVLDLLEDLQDGWSKGTLNGVEGLFPTSYVESLSETSTASLPSSSIASPSSKSVDIFAENDALRRRKERRQLLMDEMKDLKLELENQNKTREQFEKSVSELSKEKLRLKKENQYLKANLLDKDTFPNDLTKLAYSIDLLLEPLISMQNTRQLSLELLHQFNTDLQKESKNLSAVSNVLQRFIVKLKDLKAQTESIPVLCEESEKLGSDFRTDLETTMKTFDSNKK